VPIGFADNQSEGLVLDRPRGLGGAASAAQPVTAPAPPVTAPPRAVLAPGNGERLDRFFASPDAEAFRLPRARPKDEGLGQVESESEPWATLFRS
jgi:hypothetical protein